MLPLFWLYLRIMTSRVEVYLELERQRNNLLIKMQALESQMTLAELDFVFDEKLTNDLDRINQDQIEVTAIEIKEAETLETPHTSPFIQSLPEPQRS